MTELRSSHDHSVVNKILVQYGGNILYVVTATEIYAGDYIIYNVGTGKHGMCKETKLGRYCGFTAFPLLSEWFSYFVYDSMVQN